MSAVDLLAWINLFNSAVEGLANGVILGAALVWLAGLPERRRQAYERQTQRDVAAAVSRLRFAESQGQPLDLGQAEARRRGEIQ